MVHELLSEGLEVDNQFKIDILYKGKKIGIYAPDILVNKKIIVEIKSKPFLTKEDEKQFWGYLKGSKYKLGFLVIFSPSGLIIKRFIHTQKIST